MIIKKGLEIKYEEYKTINASDAYSNRIVTYGEDWAGLMEIHIEKTNELSKGVVESLGHKADTDGITGYMYGAAKQALIHFWKYGEELKDLLGSHNPAIITLKEVK